MYNKDILKNEWWRCKTKWCILRVLNNKRVFPAEAVSSDQENPIHALDRKKKKKINFILLVSSEMLCLRSFHGDHGVPWWLIDTQGAIHLYTGCVRGRAAGTSAPTTNPKCKWKGNASGLAGLSLPSDCVHLHWDGFLFPREVFLVIFCLCHFCQML